MRHIQGLPLQLWLPLCGGGQEHLNIFILFFAFLSALFGFWLLGFLTKKIKISKDAALSFVLAAFFGIGITLASRIQFTHTHAYRQIQGFLYGQTATMGDGHIFLYFLFACVVILFFVLFFKEIQGIAFDRMFLLSAGSKIQVVEACYHLLLAFSVVVGIRTVGVVLMSAMLIAPAAAARQYTNRLSILLFLAGGIGIASGFLGNYLSFYLSESLASLFPDGRASFATGPLIVLIAAFFAFSSLFLAPEKGLLARYFRIARFRFKRRHENLLKSLWRGSNHQKSVDRQELRKTDRFSIFSFNILLFYLKWKGWVQLDKKSCLLTNEGKKEGARIVRLHRLWEAYLVTHLEEGTERVHHSAEEMEHILTPELEMQLTQLLADPKEDPHAQPIPPKKEVMQHG